MSTSEQLPRELRDSLKNIESAIHELESVQLKQLSRTQHQQQEHEKEDSFTSITNQIKSELNRIDHHLEELEILADECEDESSRTEALRIVEDHRKHATRLRASFRTISLEVKRTLANNTLQSSRAELLSGATAKPGRSSNTEEALMSASSDVTQSLRNTLEIMRQELDRSVMSTHLLEQQTATLQLTSDQYMSFGELMKTSRALISTLQRADLMDRILLTGALLFFMLVCIYILKKRILDRGVSVLSTILTPLTRTTKTIINSNNNNVQPSSTSDQIVVGSSDTNDQILTAAASAATAVAVSLIPGLVSSPDLPIPPPPPPYPSGNLPAKPPPIDAHPPSADPKQSIKPDPILPSDHPVISNFELLHEEL
ncbi:hypothetical protein PGT21_029407 [Puccinia graminis f. sp. tritici]|uniref:Sec20 C-terminal domain-containing protein n=1 Tax=Puccinia graminis f. sp. tritici TaxID=56615 RepID=A0A5B0M882_PUCGR|nr:hypothetical protein PGT21_029407 [Puccinia graminis f. sp. tritici]KAA1135278.1 hypothetical protein PGTUg99_024683 [Puccinia graminis f. sp. tritici]